MIITSEISGFEFDYLKNFLGERVKCEIIYYNKIHLPVNGKGFAFLKGVSTSV